MSKIANFFRKKPNQSYPFVLDDTINVLSPDLANKVEWNVPQEHKRPEGNLFNFWCSIPGAHKWHHYFGIYEKIFAEYKNRPVRVLEIGVYKGASIKMWREYFHKDSVIVGIDIDPVCKQFEDANAKIHIRIGSQADAVFLNQVVQNFGKFDVIIDDGSHITSHMIDSFNFLFLHGLNEKGIYFVEDTHSNYWSAYRNSEKSFVDMAKSLIDVMHYHYTDSVQETDFRLGSSQQIRSFSVPKLTTMIEEIRFFDSIIVVYKNSSLTVPVSEHL